MPDARSCLKALRGRFADLGIDAYLVPSSDEHLNEYLPLSTRRREYASGFTGSAGDLLVLPTEAWLYTDSRYHLQAESELLDSGICLMKVGTPGARALSAHIGEMATTVPAFRLGIDPMVVADAQAQALEKALGRAGGRLVEIPGNLVDDHWSNRPLPQLGRLISLPRDWTGQSPDERLAALRERMTQQSVRAVVAIKLDQVAWLLGLRARGEVPHSPVFEAFAVITLDAIHVFLRDGAARLPELWAERPRDLQIAERAEFVPFLESLSGAVLCDPAAVSRGVRSALTRSTARIVEGLSPIEPLKAAKNPAERAAMRRANLAASVAKTKSLLWLRREVAAGHPVTERSFKEHIEARYREQPDFWDLSFTTISATGAHGAIIHYGACDDTKLKPGQLFLIDSGAQIGGGTTDDTRTVAVGTCDAESRRIFTLVLAGHVAAARQRVPDGAVGTSLDALARAPLWEAGLTYGHGTGHGVGAFANVHEGPFALAERDRSVHGPQPLRADYVTSIEPGYYRAGFGGVRLENLYLFERDATLPPSEPGWLRLEPLTFIPFDGTLIDRSLLAEPARQWIDAYHDACRDKLTPHLTPTEQRELEEFVGARLSEARAPLIDAAEASG